MPRVSSWIILRQLLPVKRERPHYLSQISDFANVSPMFLLSALPQKREQPSVLKEEFKILPSRVRRYRGGDSSLSHENKVIDRLPGQRISDGRSTSMDRSQVF